VGQGNFKGDPLSLQAAIEREEPLTLQDRIKGRAVVLADEVFPRPPEIFTVARVDVGKNPLLIDGQNPKRSSLKEGGQDLGKRGAHR